MALKQTILFSLLLIAGCGKIPTSEFKLGQTMNIQPSNLSSLEVSRLSTLCAALRNKAAKFPQVAGQTFTFEVGRKSCEEASLGTLSDVTVTLEEVGGSFKFKQSSGLNFIYADPETHQSGIMGTICGGASSNITNQRQQSDDQFLVFTFNTPTTECAPTADEICIRIDTASRFSNDEFRLTSREWIKFRVNETQAKSGYFLERRTLSTALCGQDQQSETVAILK